MDDKSPEINSDPDDFQSLEDYERSPESSRSVGMEEIGNLDVNPPRPGDQSPIDDEDDVNLENFRVEFGGGVRDELNPGTPTLISDVDENNEDDDEEDEETSNLFLSVGHGDNVEEIKPETESSGDQQEEEESVSQDPNLEVEEIQKDDEGNEEYEGKVDDEPSTSVPFHAGSLGSGNVLETKDVEVDDFDLNLEPELEEVVDETGGENKSEDQNPVDEEYKPDGQENLDKDNIDNEENKGEEFFDRSGRKISERDSEEGRIQQFRTKADGNLTSRSAGSKRGRSRFGNESTDLPQSDPTREVTGETIMLASSSGRTETERQRSSMDQETRDASTSSNVVVKSKRFMTPGAVIYNYERGRLSRREAFEILQEAKRSKMLHKSADKVYIDKEGDVRIPRGYSFGRSRTSDGKIKRKRGLTRIDREIQAYQKSTHMLIPRAIFARIVREIAQGWFKGEGQIKFTVEALAALQTAAEDEMVRLLETSMVCSRHAKRITLRVEDVRLARFCRGRQLYEFNNMEL